MTLITIDATTVADVLRATRGAAGYSARGIAPLIGVSHGTVSSWERGMGEPSISQFIRWAEVTGQPAGQLLQGIAPAVAA
ncbi:transcriptional repressor [Microbacterium phage Efeko]|uniref:Helix-turn-helix DNA binding domain protein n=1 Tax=Microbacterium phage Efeko TaxID=2315704 RepID=A0A386KMV9_9CAUD|nr:transcriptional repressor [Microbacterium phage Efeko]AYD86269.1 helix-turn-helix DNA binding domain protein [Microbacterium phage Efeko]